jgi:hypothetical protein
MPSSKRAPSGDAVQVTGAILPVSILRRAVWFLPFRTVARPADPVRRIRRGPDDLEPFDPDLFIDGILEHAKRLLYFIKKPDNEIWKHWNNNLGIQSPDVKLTYRKNSFSGEIF